MTLRRTNKDVPADLAETAAWLRSERPEATELELDRAKQRVLVRVRHTQQTGGFMRTRIALMSILALGGLMSFTGGALAVSELTAAQENAGEAVYPGDPDVDNTGDDDRGVGGESESGGSGSGGGSDTLGDGSESGDVSDSVQPAAQSESTDSGELPFTGYAAIPLLLIGIGLLATGVMLRRRADSPDLS